MKHLFLPVLMIAISSGLYAQSVFVPDEGSFYVKSNDKFFLYENGVSLTDLNSAWADNHLLVYSPSNSITYALYDYKSGLDNTLYPAEKIKTNDHYVWRTNGSSYWIYYKATNVKGFKSFWLNEDLIVYDTIRDLTFQLEGYKTAPTGKIFPLTIKDKADTLAYFTDGKSFWLYKKGNYISTQNSFWTGGHLNAFEMSTGITYQLPDYKNAQKFTLYPAKEAFRGIDYTWTRSGTTFWLFNKGASVDGVKSYWIGRNLGVYHPATNTTFLLRDYSTGRDSVLYVAEFLSRTENLFWWYDGKYFFVADKGEIVNLEKSASFWLKDDLIVYSPDNNTTYRFVNYQNRTINNLIQPVIISNTNTAIWFTEGEGYLLYDKCVKVAVEDSYWEGTNLIVKDRITKQLYVLADYNNAKDGKLRIATLK